MAAQGMSVHVAQEAAGSGLLGDLDHQLRELVRREGVDPQHEAPRVRRLAEQVVRAHDERSLTGVVAPVPDPHAVVGELVARVAGFGPLQHLLDDPEVEEIWVNEPAFALLQVNGSIGAPSPRPVRNGPITSFGSSGSSNHTNVVQFHVPERIHSVVREALPNSHNPSLLSPRRRS